MKTTTCYMAVQVVQRTDGKLSAWYDGEQRASHSMAAQDARKNAKEFPGTEYAVVRREITELGTSYVKKEGKG